MSSRITSPVQSVNNRTVEIAGRIAPNGTGAVSIIQGLGFTASRTGTGQITVVTREPFYAILDATADLQLNSTTPTAASLVVNGTSSGVMTITSDILGSEGNNITLTILAAAGSASTVVTATGSTIDIVHQIPMAGETIAAMVSSINGVVSPGIATAVTTHAGNAAALSKTALAGALNGLVEAQLGAVTGGKSAPFSVVINTVSVDTGAAVDVAANANNQLHFTLELRDSSVA